MWNETIWIAADPSNQKSDWLRKIVNGGIQRQRTDREDGDIEILTELETRLVSEESMKILRLAQCDDCWMNAKLRANRK